MQKENKYYFLGVICWILAIPNAIYFFIKLFSGYDIISGFAFLLLFGSGLGCLANSELVRDNRIKKEKHEKMLAENEGYYQKMQNLGKNQ